MSSRRSPERGQPDDDHAEAIVQIRPELLLAMARSRSRLVAATTRLSTLIGTGAADGPDLALFQHPQ